MRTLEGPGALWGSARYLATPALPRAHLQRGKLRHSLAGKFLVPLGRGDEVSKHQPPVVNVPCSQQLRPAVAIEPLDPKPLPGGEGAAGLGGLGTGPALVGAETNPFKDWGLKPP